MFIVTRVLLILAISLVSLLISLILDRILAPLNITLQFLIQVPTLVIIIDSIRQTSIDFLTNKFDLTLDDVNGAFFFAAPLAATGSSDLMGEIRSFLA